MSAENANPLHLKYRPRNLDEVIGQHAAVTALDRVLNKRTSAAFLLSGPSGTGKTTLARIAARTLGCKPQSVVEIDAATNSGIDQMRAVSDAIRYPPLVGDKKAVIIDEAHGLSRNAWDSLLKPIEEPPKHAFWFFCTTNPAKVPETIRTRCTNLMLKALPEKQIRELVQEIAGLEKIKLDQSVLDLVVREARGSARQALVNLAACDGVKDRKQAAELLRAALETDATRALCQFLMRPGSVHVAQSLISKIDDNPEGVRIVVMNYFRAVCQGARSPREFQHALHVMDSFCTPYNSAEGFAPLWLSVGRVMFPPT